MTVSFLESEMVDLQYELNDAEIVNDVLCIVGDAGAEVLVRGYDGSSVDKYGRRSYRINNPIVANVLANYATPKAQATAILDRNIQPYAVVTMTVVSTTAAITTKLLALEISDLVQLTVAACGLNAAYFIIETLDLTIDTVGYITVTVNLVAARANEIP